MDFIVSKAGKRLYVLYQLKRAGIGQKDVLSIYLSVIRPVLEYDCQVWHSSLPKYLCNKIEISSEKSSQVHLPRSKI